jgi:hypothetical protein
VPGEFAFLYCGWRKQFAGPGQNLEKAENAVEYRGVWYSANSCQAIAKIGI